MQKALALLLLLAAPASAKQARYYMVAHSGPGDPYWAVEYKGAMDAGKALGAQVIFSAPDTSGDITKEVNMLQAAIAANPDGIAVTIPDARAFSKPLQDAKRKGIPVVAFDTQEEKRDPKGLPYLAYIGGNEYTSGQKVGAHAAETLAKGARAVIVTHLPGHMGLELRMGGIRDALKRAGASADKLDITANPSKGIGILKSYLKAHPDTKAVFALGPLGTATVGKCLGELGLQGKIVFATFDLDDLTLKYLNDGTLSFTMDQMPYMQAYMSITQLHLASAYSLHPVDMDTGSGFVDKSNAAQVAALVKAGYR